LLKHGDWYGCKGGEWMQAASSAQEPFL
jgi:hypothetical protein